MRLKSFVIEASVVLVVFVASAWWGAAYTRASLEAGRQPRFYQEYFEPAVMMACGYGFVAGVPDMAPRVRAFLQLQVEQISCDDIPRDIVVSKNALYQTAWLYLIGAVGITWTLLGISWSALAPLSGFLFAISIASVYLIARFGMGRTLAVAVAGAMAVSTLHLLNLPHLRDYSKAPFVLASIVVLFALVTRPPTWRGTPVYAGLYGVILGIGYGFRTDLLAGLPVIVMTLGAFLPGGITRFAKLKVASFAVFASAFLLFAWPVLNWVSTKGGCQWHVILLGLAPSFDAELGVSRAVVQWGPTYSDSYLYATISAYADRVAPEQGAIEFCTPVYDRLTAQYLREVASYAPGDFIARAYSSVLRITELPFPWYGDPIDGYVPPLYMARGALLHTMRGFGWVPVVLSLAVLGGLSLRLGLFALFFLCYFGGYPALQFANRHYFHLEFITWWAFGFVIQLLLITLMRRRLAPSGERPSFAPFSAKRFFVFTCVAVALVFVPLTLARWYQQQRTADLVSRLVAAPSQPLSFERSSDGVMLLPSAPTPHQAPDLREMQYLRLELDPQHCGDATVTMRYSNGRTDLNRDIQTTIANRPVRLVMAPAYWNFRGVEVTRNGSPVDPGCLRSVHRVDVPRAISVLPTIALPEDWGQLNLYQEIRR